MRLDWIEDHIISFLGGGELVNLALSRDDGLGTQGLRVLIDPENRSAQEAATTASHPSPAERERRCGYMTDGRIQKSCALFQIPAVIFENTCIGVSWVTPLCGCESTGP